MQSKNHWDKVYTNKAPDNVSWFQAHADMSMRPIRQTGLSHDASIIDVGAGAFTLLAHEEQLHHTPFGTDQQFVYCLCRKMLA